MSFKMSTLCFECVEQVKESMTASNKFYKKNKNDLIWWVDNAGIKGEWLFSFDKKRVFNMFRDYPHELTKEQKKIFDKENPFWADFFKDRTHL